MFRFITLVVRFALTIISTIFSVIAGMVRYFIGAQLHIFVILMVSLWFCWLYCWSFSMRILLCGSCVKYMHTRQFGNHLPVFSSALGCSGADMCHCLNNPTLHYGSWPFIHSSFGLVKRPLFSGSISVALCVCLVTVTNVPIFTCGQGH